MRVLFFNSSPRQPGRGLNFEWKASGGQFEEESPTQSLPSSLHSLQETRVCMFYVLQTKQTLKARSLRLCEEVGYGGCDWPYLKLRPDNRSWKKSSLPPWLPSGLQPLSLPASTRPRHYNDDTLLFKVKYIESKCNDRIYRCLFVLHWRWAEPKKKVTSEFFFSGLLTHIFITSLFVFSLSFLLFVSFHFYLQLPSPCLLRCIPLLLKSRC